MSTPDAIDDPYLWLEDVTGARALEWVRARNEVTTQALAQSSAFESLRARLLSIFDSKERIPYVAKHGEFFYNFWRDAEHVRGVWRRTTLDEYKKSEPAWDVVLDLDALATAEGENWVWHGAALRRPDRTRALVSLSRGGADATVTREFDLTTRGFVPDGFELKESKGGMSWRDADSVFVETDFGPGTMTESGYPRIAKWWRRGTPLESAELVYEGLPSDIAVSAHRDHTPGYVRDFVSRSITFFTNELFWLRPGAGGERADLVRIEKPNDVSAGTTREWIVFEPRNDWVLGDKTYRAGSLLAARFDEYIAGERNMHVLFEPGERTSLAGFGATKNAFLLNLLDNVRNRLFVLRHERGQWHRTGLEGVPDIGSVNASAVDSNESDEYFLEATDELTPTSLFMGTIGRGAPEKLRSLPAFFDTHGLVIEQHEATSKDGTRIPYCQVGRAQPVADEPHRSASDSKVGDPTRGSSTSVHSTSHHPTSIHPTSTQPTSAQATSAHPTSAPGASAHEANAHPASAHAANAHAASAHAASAHPSGARPTLLYGYGGFEVSLTPSYKASFGAGWLERGGVLVVANIRGGGEFGPKWHQAALKANRHKAYEDFAAVAEDLIARGVTSPAHLGCEGGSNGGLLVGNMLTTYPHLFGAIVCVVPLLDMRRYTKLLAGASWAAEYGDPDDAKEWEFLQLYSPYHNVRADATYPPTLFTTSTRDDRVHPGHARKMVARLAELGHRPLYYENIEGGHGGSANNAQAAFMSTLAFEFLWKNLS